MIDLDPKTLAQRYAPQAAGTLKPEGQLCCLRYSVCGSFLAAGGFDGRVHLWNVGATQPSELKPLEGHDGWVQSLAFHPDGRRLFSVDSWGRLCGWMFRDEGTKPLWTVERAHSGWIRQVAVSPDGECLATCGADRTIRIRSLEGRERAQWTDYDEDVFALAFHPDGKSLVAGDLKGVVRQRNTDTGEIIREFDAAVLYKLDRIQDVGGVRCLAFDPEGRYLACAGMTPKTGAFVMGTPTILIFDAATGSRKHVWTIGGENDGFVHELRWHPDGFVMAVTSGQPGNGRLIFQRPGDPEPFFTHTGMANCHTLAIHPAGRRLAVSATNAGSNGNGRQLDDQGVYRGNSSPIHFWDLPEVPATGKG